MTLWHIVKAERAINCFSDKSTPQPTPCICDFGQVTTIQKPGNHNDFVPLVQFR